MSSTSHSRGRLNRRIVTEGESKSRMESQADERDKKFIACLLLLPEDSEPLLELLHKLASREDLQTLGVTRDSKVNSESASEDIWLDHGEAAAYLGVSPSTLYHYSCRQVIERRKFAGRLQYRRSTLDHFKEAHTLPASSRRASPHIIAAAHSSGK
jgi:Helix-turn-helix domain